MLTPKILFVSADFPYPADHGGRIDILRMLKTLKMLNCTVDLLCTVKEIPCAAHLQEIEKYYCASIHFVLRNGSVKGFLPKKSYHFETRRRLRDFNLNQQHYDCLILETEHVAAILENNTFTADKKWVRIHNNETQYYASLGRSSSSLFKKMYYQREANFLAHFSPKVFAQMDKLLFISSKEYEENKPNFPHKGIFMPPHTTIQAQQQTLANPIVLSIGNLFTQNNIEGLLWYLDHVHPIVTEKNPRHTFIIAGNTRGQGLPWLSQYQQKFNNITFYDTPNELAPLYAQARVFINPMRNGAGLKLKTLNAIEFGLPMVSTSIGTEGTGLQSQQHVLIADSVDDFSQAVNKLLLEPEFGRTLVSNAQSFITQTYNQTHILQTLLAELA